MIFLVVIHEYNAILRRTVFRNTDKRPRNVCQYSPPLSTFPSCIEPSSIGNSKVIQKASSMTIDFEFPSIPFHLIQLSGRFVYIVDRYIYLIDSFIHIICPYSCLLLSVVHEMVMMVMMMIIVTI